jgi:hypothetical protein
MKRKSQATVLHHYSATEQKIQTARKLWKHALDNRVRLTPRTEDSPTTNVTNQE